MTSSEPGTDQTATAGAPRRRIGDAERDAAMTALGEHMRAGRIDPSEYSERAERAGSARFQDELDPLFHDLPPVPSVTPVPLPPVQVPQPPLPTGRNGLPPLGGALGVRLIGAASALSLPAFFVIGALGGWAWAWVVFLVPGVLGGVVYGDKHGPGGGAPWAGGHNRDRQRRRNRC